jgi:uncharacterized membrane protein (UPF0182 family)
MAETFELGLAKLFSGSIAPTARIAAADTTVRGADTTQTLAAPSTASSPLLREAQDHYDRAISAQKAGDWATYGDEIRKLGEILRQINAPRR